eukprot:g3438.t1
MNVSDSEIIRSVLLDAGMRPVSRGSDEAGAGKKKGPSGEEEEADVILINTCAIRDKAESRIWGRLSQLKNVKRRRRKSERPVVGVLGCMAERLKKDLLEREQLVDLVAGPDAYRSLPRLIETAAGDEAAIDVQLSVDETYADIRPVRDSGSGSSGGVSAFASIMRGCNNMCSYCVVPFTRGRERSRDAASIVAEVAALSEEGYKEVVLLGQNVNSYHDASEASKHSFGADTAYHDAPEGFKNLYARTGKGFQGGARFADLLQVVADVDPEMRVRFTSPHPKDFSDDVLSVIAAHPNICRGLHMPAQSGSDGVLRAMRRGYTSAAYLDLVARMRDALGPGLALTSDFISGFCGETDADHAATLALLEEVGFANAFMYAYSVRPRTHADHRMEDDVPEEVKKARLQEVIATFRRVAAERNKKEVGTLQLVLVNGHSNKRRHGGGGDNKGKAAGAPRAPGAAEGGRTQKWLTGLTDSNKRCMFPDVPVPGTAGGLGSSDDAPVRELRAGDYAVVHVTDAGVTNLHAEALYRTTLVDYATTFHGGASCSPVDTTRALDLVRALEKNSGGAGLPRAGAVAAAAAAAAAGV